MNGNNSWQRMGQFARFPRHNLGPVSQPHAGELFPVGELMKGGGIPMPAMMPQQPMPQQPTSQQYGQDQPQGKKIMGMPKDRFIALMGSIAQAFGGDSASGRMGANLINMAGMLREERLGKGKAQAEMAETRRKEAATAREEARAKKEKIPSSWEAFYGEKKGQVNPKTNRPWTEAGIYTAFKKVGAKEPAVPKGQAGFEQIEGVWHKGTWRENKFTPWREASPTEVEKLMEVKPAAGEEPKEMSWAEKRARAKELRVAEETALGVDPKTNIPNAEFSEVQISTDFFNEESNKSYVLRRVSGTPKEEKSFMGVDILRPDVPAIPATMEKIPISQFKTPDDVMSADWLSDKAKRRLIEKLFSNQFRK